MDIPKKGLYRHYSGKIYEMLGMAKQSVTLSPMVAYRTYGSKREMWVCPLASWQEKVTLDGCELPRFRPIKAAELAGEMRTQSDSDEKLWRFVDGKLVKAEAPMAKDFSLADEAYKMIKALNRGEVFPSWQLEALLCLMSNQDVLLVQAHEADYALCCELLCMMRGDLALMIVPDGRDLRARAEALRARGIPADCVCAEDEMMDEASLRSNRMLLVPAEMLGGEAFLKLISKMKLSLVAIDAAQSVSKWHAGYCETYAKIKRFLARLRTRPRVCALAEASNAQVRDDILRLLGLNEPIIISANLARSNLFLLVAKLMDKDAQLQSLIDSYRGFCGVLYCKNAEAVDALSKKLMAAQYAFVCAHEGMRQEDREQALMAFESGKAPLIVLSSVLRTELHRTDIRFVIHCDTPADIESYYREIGCAGLDGERADCHLLYEPLDILLHERLIKAKTESARSILRKASLFRLRAMQEYCETSTCLRNHMLNYFGEGSKKPCMYCGNCVPLQAVGTDESKNEQIQAEVIKKPEPTSIIPPEALKVPERPRMIQGKLPEDVDKTLFDRLDEVRHAYAAAKHISSHMICSDASLIDMCRRCPKTKLEMMGVYGMGEKRVRDYAERFLEAIRIYRPR